MIPMKKNFALWKTWIFFMEFLLLCDCFFAIMSFMCARYVFPEFSANPPGNHRKSLTKTFGTTWNRQQQSPGFLWSENPNGPFNLPTATGKQFASKWIIWIIVVDGSFKDVWIKRLPCEIIQFDHHVVFSNKVWSDSTALQESRSWVWKLSLILCFGDIFCFEKSRMKWNSNSRIHPDNLLPWPPVERKVSGRRFALCVLWCRVRDRGHSGQNWLQKCLFDDILFQPKTTILWSFCPFEPWPYLVFRYPVASWCISIYGENKECSYRVYVFTFIYTYSWESTTISDFEFGGDFNFKERSLGAEATVVGWWWKAWTPSEFLQDDHVLWFGGTPFQ